MQNRDKYVTHSAYQNSEDGFLVHITIGGVQIFLMKLDIKSG